MANVDFNSTILGLKSRYHFCMISLLLSLLPMAITVATIYAYFNIPDNTFGFEQPPSPEKEKEENVTKNAILEVVGGYTLLPFVVLSFLSGFVQCFKHKMFVFMCAIITISFALTFLVYDGVVLFYFEYRFVWPPQMIPTLLEVNEQIEMWRIPFTAEDQMVYKMEVLVYTITICFFLVISILSYCGLILLKLSFSKTPKPFAPRRRRPPPPTRDEEDDDEDDQTQPGTGADDDEKKEKSKIKTQTGTGGDDDEKEKSKIKTQTGTGTDADDKDKDEKKKEKTQTGGDQTGTGTGTFAD